MENLILSGITLHCGELTDITIKNTPCQLDDLRIYSDIKSETFIRNLYDAIRTGRTGTWNLELKSNH